MMHRLSSTGAAAAAAKREIELRIAANTVITEMKIR